MPSDWSIDLLVAVDERDGRGTGLERELRGAIRDGRLAPGTRLPSTRALASDLGWARGTVAGAYMQLTAEGWLTARAGAGTVVAAGAEEARADAPVAPAERCRGTTCAPAARTWRASRAPPGPPRSGARCARPPTPRCGSATRAGGSSCAARWPPTSAAPAGWSPRRPDRRSAAATSRRSGCWRPCSAGGRPSPWRTPAWRCTARSCAPPGCAWRRCPWTRAERGSRRSATPTRSSSRPRTRSGSARRSRRSAAQRSPTGRAAGW